MKIVHEKKSEMFSKQVGEKAQRKLKALHEDKRAVWFGLGMMGMVGWTVVVPTLLGCLMAVMGRQKVSANPFPGP